ncbi:FAD/NAD(P)-binding protein [Pseudomonas sp. R2.Fl]|nr:FAD/NAD(P)-binding protein [Pseudomonas sp. R2.Fl]
MTGPTTSPAVAVIGGGFSGAALAIHLRRRYGGRSPLRIVVFEPRERLGLGLAYGTREPAHRINVPADAESLKLAIRIGDGPSLYYQDGRYHSLR